MCGVLSLAGVMGFVGCKVPRTEAVAGVDSPPNCSRLLPACLCPVSGEWCRACWALRSGGASPVVVGSACCSVGMASWVVRSRGDGDGGPPGIRLVHVVLLVPADPSIAIVAPGWRCLSWEGVHPFGRVCVRSGFWNACGADGLLPGRFCAAFLESISC